MRSDLSDREHDFENKVKLRSTLIQHNAIRRSICGLRTTELHSFFFTDSR